MIEGRTNSHVSTRIGLIDIKSYHSKEKYRILISKKYFSFLFISNGKAFVIFDNKEYIIHAPAIICLSNRDQISDFTLYTETQISIIYFDTAILAKNMDMERVLKSNFTDLIDQHCFCQLEPFLEKDFRRKCFVLSCMLNRSFSQIVLRLKKQFAERPDDQWMYKMRSGLLGILMWLEKIQYDSVIPHESETPNYTEEKETFKQLLKYVINNLDQTIKLEDLYRKFFINIQTIERLFHKYLGMTYKKYVRNQRFELSKQNLRFTKFPLKEVANKAGYASTQSFCKFFKEMSGTTPSAFRKEQAFVSRVESKRCLVWM